MEWWGEAEAAAAVRKLPPVILRVALGESGPLLRQIVQRENGRDRTHRNAGAAIDAFHRIDVEHLFLAERRLIFLGMNAIHRAGVHTGGVLGSDARLCNHVCHKYLSPWLVELCCRTLKNPS